MATKEIYKSTHHGTRQSDRLPKALAEDFIRIDERSFQDMVQQIYRYSRRLKFFNGSNREEGNWESFFHSIATYDKTDKVYLLDRQKMEAQMQEGDVQPHLALLLAFLKLFGIEQEHLNSLNRRHLDFYYKDILRFSPRTGSPGKAEVFFELNKAAQSVFLPKGSLFDAGKDAENKPVYYESTDEINLNKAVVSRIYHCVRNQEENSFTPLDIPTGKETKDTSGKESTAFALMVSSDGFLLPDGKRELVFEGIPLSDCFSSVSYTCEKGWEKAIISENIICIRADQPAFSAYNADVHGGNLSVKTPVLKLISARCTLPDVSNASCLVTLTGSRDFEIRNTLGIVSNTEGSFPFGTQCRINDFFKIKLPHIPEDIPQIYIRCRSEEELTANSDYKITPDNKNPVINVSLIKDTFDRDKIAKEYAQYLLQVQKAKNEEEANAIEVPQFYRIPELSESIGVDYSFSITQDRLKLIPQTPLNQLMGNASVNMSFCKNYFDDTPGNYLYIGLENAQNMQNVSLYFRLNPMIPTNGKGLNWSYFNGKEWSRLASSDIFKDTTRQLQNSGMVYLHLKPERQDSLIWLKVTLDDCYDFRCIQEIRTQVAELAYASQSPGQAANGTPLPANTISKSLNTIAGIKKIEQPYPGQEGTFDETDERFVCRVSEKLRHKGRAWTCWDYERLVLEKFPQIAAAKCIPTYNPDSGNTLENGSICVLLIPEKCHTEQDNPLCPQVTESLRLQVTEYLKSCCSPFVRMHVCSPEYAEVEIHCRATLRKGYNDPEHYQNLLNEQLVHFLAPWSTEETAATFYRELNESDILAFIENAGYIDHIEELTVSIGKQTVLKGGDIAPQGSATLLTSAEKHDIILTI